MVHDCAAQIMLPMSYDACVVCHIFVMHVVRAEQGAFFPLPFYFMGYTRLKGSLFECQKRERMPNNFITNASEDNSLKERMHTLIRHSQELKFLVGFFYFSGWGELYQALQARDDLHLKILVGLDVDNRLRQAVEIADPQANARTQDELVGRFFASLQTALQDETLDGPEFYEQVGFFLRLLEEGRLEIRKTLDPNHAKLYLFRFNKVGQELVNAPGSFITGSSNLTKAGLFSQQEFNVEIRDYGWKAAEAYFDDLWDFSVPVSAEEKHRRQIIRIVRRQTQVAAITPFEAYALVLKTYLDLMEQKQLRPSVKRRMEARGYRVYRYQEEAVQQALTVLDEYGGVILADVVGLGKSVIASWLARERDGRGLVLCPPALMGDPATKATGWHKYLNDFGLHDWEVYSLGALDKAQDYLAQYGDDVRTIIVDEAHRFRNEDTEAYERLSQICANRAVILLTATPFNNTPADIFSLLKLFTPPGKSTLTLDEDLAARFGRYNSEFRKLSYILRHHDAGGQKQKRAERYCADIFAAPLPVDLARVRRRVRQLSAEIRSVIAPVVIRRNRLDLKRDPLYAQEIADLSAVADPHELFFELTPEQSAFYDQVINEYFGEDGRFRGAIYQPFTYEHRGRLEDLDEESNRAYLQQRNLYDFMRRLLVKRFESSFGAFARSIENFIRIHERVLAFITNSGGRYILDRQLLEKIYAAAPDEIEAALDDFLARLDEKEKPNPRHDRIYVLDDFADKQGFLDDIQADLDLLRTIQDRIQALDLVGDDPKARRLVKALQTIVDAPPAPGEPRRKVVVFSEYLDTVQHIAPWVEEAFPGRVLVADGGYGKAFFAELLANFDASHPAEKQRDDYDILIATDKLSEGVNLNRAGAVIDYDIPWNPTRVIQRLGRINRIGRKVFETLYIYNFFPTRQGADVVQSREIAAQKMFLIHNTLGEDAKIFAPDEEPSPADLFARLNRNPEDEEEESLLTHIRQRFFAIREAHPELVAGLDDFPARVKTAKMHEKDELLVFRRKGLQLFVHYAPDTAAEKNAVQALTLDESLEHIVCSPKTPRLALSPRFWPAYETVKKHREHVPMPDSETSLQRKAEFNLRSALQHQAAALQEDLPFIRTLLRDLKEFQTLPKYTLRRLTAVEMTPQAIPQEVQRFRRELDTLRRALGEDYLERLEARLRGFRSEIIIAIENQATLATLEGAQDEKSVAQ